MLQPQMGLSDSDVVARVLQGDAPAFRTLVERHQDRLFDLAFRLTGHRQEAEDIVQTAFLKMYSKLGKYDPGWKFSNWAYSVTLNAARDARRRKSLLRFLSLDAPEDEESPPREPEGTSPAPDRELEARETLAELHRRLRGLPADLSAPFILRHFHHAEIEDIAQTLGVSKNLVNVRLFRARERLWRELGEGVPR
jgi:RNA polymerase sigma-70 factor, ECF subfamily